MSDDSPLSVDQSFVVGATFQQDPQGGNRFALSAGVSASATVNLAGITVTVEDIELAVSFGVAAGQGGPGSGLAISAGLKASPPKGASATVDLPAVRGEGDLIFGDDGSWEGALLLQLATLSVDAFALVGGGDPDVSFVIVLCARFPEPGIQVGFGFAVTGVGGIFGLNRRSDSDALTAAILDGSLAGLLFPTNAHDDAHRIVKNLPILFPHCHGQVIVGPMLEITWAGGLLTAEVMVLLELPDPLKISVLGRLKVDLPFGEAAIVHIEARVGAFVTPSIPEFRLVASLTGSYIAGFPLTGDLFLLIRGGSEATFVFSAGGFHPAVTPPPNVPPMKRLGMTMSLSFIELRCESYLAVTTSSVQLGALVEMSAMVGDGCGIHGNFGFDALIEWKPQFHLRVDVHIGLAVEVFGENLCGVSFDGYLSGPGPWILNGRGEVDVLWVSVPIPINATFGSAPSAAITVRDVGGLLVQELSKPSSWTVHPPQSSADGVTLSPTARADLAAARVLHPGGGLKVAQRLLPLGLLIDRFGGYAVPEQCWDITDVQLGDDPPSGTPSPVYDTFADGTFTTLTVEQQLTTNGFTAHRAGVQITTTGLMAATVGQLDVVDDWDTHVIGADPPTGGIGWELANLTTLIPYRSAAVTVAAAGNPVTVAAQPPLAANVTGQRRLEMWETR